MFVGRNSGRCCQVPASDTFHMVAELRGTKDTCLHAIVEGWVMSFNLFCFNVRQTYSMTGFYNKLRWKCRQGGCALSSLRMVLSDLEHARTRLTGASVHLIVKLDSRLPGRPTSLINLINNFFCCHHHIYAGWWRWVIISGSLKKKDLARKHSNLMIISGGCFDWLAANWSLLPN